MTKRRYLIMMAACLTALALLLGATHIYPQKENIKPASSSKTEIPTRVILGNERLLEEFSFIIENKRVGIITNQTGITPDGEQTFRKLYQSSQCDLTAIYVPEHGLDGFVEAGEYIESYTHPELNIPVFSLYNDTRMPTKEMLDKVDVLIFDIQDIGSRAYTYISTLNYSMQAAAEFNKTIVVLDRPNPLGDNVDGFVLEKDLESFVGVDTLPLSHGMTVAELAQFFNREIGAKLMVIPMKNYFRDMIFQETGLPWTMTSPNIPNLEAAFCYMATGMGDGTGVFQDDAFSWVGYYKLENPEALAERLNSAALPGVNFIAEDKERGKGVRLEITNYKSFSPCTTGIYTLAYIRDSAPYSIPRRGETLFEKIWGTERIGRMLKAGDPPEKIIGSYQEELAWFLAQRDPYLIYQKMPESWMMTQ